MTYEDFQHTFGWRNEEILRELLGTATPDQRVAQLGERKEELYRAAVRGRVKPLPGAVRLLRELREVGFRQAVASSAPRANIELILEELGIEGEFDTVLCDRDVDRGKPDPQVFLRAAGRLGVDPSHCLVVEDAVMGVQAARSAGMACLAVTTTHSVEGLMEADRVIASLTEATVEDVKRLIDSRE
jgi:beta-phosphoglucomutase